MLKKRREKSSIDIAFCSQRVLVRNPAEHSISIFFFFKTLDFSLKQGKHLSAIYIRVERDKTHEKILFIRIIIFSDDRREPTKM